MHACMHAPVHVYIHTQFTWTYRHVHTCMHELICKYAHKESLDCLGSCSSFCPSTIRLHCIRTSFFASVWKTAYIYSCFTFSPGVIIILNSWNPDVITGKTLSEVGWFFRTWIFLRLWFMKSIYPTVGFIDFFRGTFLRLEEFFAQPWDWRKWPRMGMRLCGFCGHWSLLEKWMSSHSVKTIGHFRLLPRNLTWNLKMMVSKRNLLFQGLLFRFRVKFQGCMKFISFWSFFFKILDGVLVLIQWCFCLTPSYSMSWNGSRSGRVFVVRLWAWSRSPWEKHHVNLAQMATKHIIFLYV